MKIRDVTMGAPTGWWVTDDKSSAHVKANSYRNLKHTIITHRKANNLEWSNEEVEAMIHRQLCAREHQFFCAPMDQGEKYVNYNPANQWGPHKWAELHRTALAGALTKEWYVMWRESLPNAGCGCRAHWNSVVLEIPFQATFEWTWRVHDEVSRRLGNTRISMEQAKELWK